MPGVGQVNLAGEREQEISITLDAARMAARNIQLVEVQQTLRRAVDVSGGFADVGRRRYTVQFLGQRKIPALDELVVAWKSGEPVYLREIAKVEVKLQKRQFLSLRNGFPAYYVSMLPSFDANTVVFSTPDLGKGEAELRPFPREQRISLAGLDRLALANIVRAYTDGLFAGEYFDGNYRYDVILHGPMWSSPEELAAMPLATPQAGVQTIVELADIERGIGPSQLQRVDARRTVTIMLVPPNNVTMEEALQRLRDAVELELKPLLPAGARIDYRGSADRLAHALHTIAVNFMLAILILFLIMAAMFKSPRDSLLVLLVMPMAVAGGVVGLKLLNLIAYQSLDLLTMIGFIILLGLVVNNAILLVDQMRSAQRNGLAARAAVHQAVLYRARPIFMSTLTSLCGMLPLMIIPGVGSEIYRGLATVIVGGMAGCALFTLILLPSLLRMGEVKLPVRNEVELKLGELAE